MGAIGRLPEPAKRFADTAKRLESLAAGHPMEDWLRFMERLAEADGDAAAAFPSPSPVASLLVERAVKERLPPIASDDPLICSFARGPRRDPQ